MGCGFHPLFPRSIFPYTTPDLQNSYFTYGSIVNTDGSHSGTTGEKVTAVQGSAQRRFEVIFAVDATDEPRCC